MSAELYRASDSSGNNANLQGTAVGGIKPLHRFIKGQPKIVGIIALVLGSSFFLLAIAIAPENLVLIGANDPSLFLQGTMFILCGILYILTEHNPTKKKVTISLALSIVTILGVCWTLLRTMPYFVVNHRFGFPDFSEDNTTDGSYLTSEEVGTIAEGICLIYSVLGAVIFIVMSCLAVASLRSTKSQAVVMMTIAANETPVE
ncbi:uncharacterized protein ACO6RY_11612 [Pungitius sinensis]